MEFKKDSSHTTVLVVRATSKINSKHYTKQSRFEKQFVNYHNLPSPVDYYAQHLPSLTPRSGWAMALCPFHNDKKPSLSVHIQKGCFQCFACGASGKSIIGFHAKKYGLSFNAARKALEGKC